MRIERRADLRSRGRKPAKPQYVYCVRTTQVAIPDWMLECAVPGLPSNEDAIWLASGDKARYLAKLDVDAGGTPTVDKIGARRCQLCGLLKLNLLAAERARLDESAFDGRDLPCGPECLMRHKQRRGQI